MGQTPNTSTPQKNQGEGNRDAARAYNQGAQETAKSGKDKQGGRDAQKALDGREGDELRRAEQQGKDRAAEHDPRETQDFRRKS